MPRVPTDYSQTCIYKLVHKDDIDNENIYIGSTTNFRHRKNTHKSSCNCESSKEYNNAKYQFIRENGGWDNWIMVEVEKYPCNDKREAEARERYWIEHFQSKLNKYIPTRTDEEWYASVREKYLLKFKENYRNNKEQYSQKNKEWAEKNKEKMSEYKKDWYTQNKDRITEYQHNWYEKNKDRLGVISKQKYENNKVIINQKVECECGCEVCKRYISAHRKSAKHHKLMERLNTPL